MTLGANVGGCVVGDGVTVELEPRFTPEELGRIAWRLFALFVVLVVAAGLVGWSMGLFSDSARGVNDTRVLGNTVAVWLALAGLAVLFVGVFAALADLTQPKGADANSVEAEALAAVPATGAVAALGKSLGEAFANLKGATAIIVAGLLLVLTSGLLAWQSVPEAACETDLTSHTETVSGPNTTIVSTDSSTKGIGPCGSGGTPTPSTTVAAPTTTEAVSSGSGDSVPADSGGGNSQTSGGDTSAGD